MSKGKKKSTDRRRILLGCEFLAGRSHIERLEPIATALRAAEFDTVIAIPGTDHEAIFANTESGELPSGLSIIKAPEPVISSDPAIRGLPTDSFADVLYLLGHAYGEEVGRRVDAWTQLVSKIKPDVVIGDLAPSLRLATRGKVPMIVVGRGYSIPPPDRPMVPIRPWRQEVPEASAAREQELLSTINRVLTERDLEPLSYLVDMVRGDATYVCSTHFADPYRDHRTTTRLAPFDMPEDIVSRGVGAREPDTLVAYLPDGHPQLDSILAAIKATDHDCEMRIVGISPENAQAMSTDKIRITGDPIDFHGSLPAAQAVIHHGGQSISIASLLAGTRQVIVPVGLEHLVSSHGVQNLGCARLVGTGPDWPAERITEVLRVVLANEAMAERAFRRSDLVYFGEVRKGLETIVERCTEFVGEDGE